MPTSSAQSRVEDYIRAESCLSSVDKPTPIENEEKASYCWRIIRKSVQKAATVSIRADSRDLVIVHGIQHSRTLNHNLAIVEMIVNNKSKEYVTFDGKMLRIFQADGRRKDIITPTEPFTRLIYATHVNLYVGWSPGQDKLYLLNDVFEVISTSTAEGPLQTMIYNEHIAEVIAIGKGFFTSWVFRYSGRYIVPRKTSRTGFNDDDKFGQVVLEETASHNQKLFYASGAAVSVFNVQDGNLLIKKKDLHVRSITALVHFNPLKYLITAAKDGSIKVWDDKWHVQLVFVGHGGKVTSLAVFPHGPNIMSASEDCTLRVWSLETCDQVDQIQLNDPVSRLWSRPGENRLFSVTGTQGDLWSVRHVHNMHTRIGHQVNQIKATDHPEYPLRTVLLCSDSSVRIVSPSTGDVLTTLLQPLRRHLVDAAYAIADDILYAVYEDGAIVKCATCTNPCTVLDEWQCSDPKKACNYLLVYEYVISAELGGDIWGGMKRAIAAGGVNSPKSAGRKSKASANRTLLLGGRKDGHICVFNRDTGEIEFEIEAHGTKGVLSMISNSKADQLISAGLDNIIKIWRLYPYAQESLAPLMSFFCAHTPVKMSVLRTSLAVAFQEPTTATYSIVVYNLKTKDRHDHGPESDHMDSITGLSSCRKMKLLASCSNDGSIRIWSETNILIREIRLNAIPLSLTFCSDKGDILVGLGDYLHKIDHKHYLPKEYRFKMVTMQFQPEYPENALPYDEALLLTMSRDDVKRLKAARSSFKFTHFVDILTEAENDEVTKEKKIREEAFAELETRDELLHKIKDGELTVVKKTASTPMTKREAFDKYLSIFYNRTFITIPDEEFSLEESVRKHIEVEAPKVEEKYVPEREPTGFFPPHSRAKAIPVPPMDDGHVKPMKEGHLPPPVKPMEEGHVPSPVKPMEEGPVLPPHRLRGDGFVPNSVLVRLLWPTEVLQKEQTKRSQETYRPPQLTAAQLAQISAIRKETIEHNFENSSRHSLQPIEHNSSPHSLQSFESDLPERTMVLDYDDDDSAIRKLSVDDKPPLPKQVEEIVTRPPSPKSKTPEAVLLHRPSIPPRRPTIPDNILVRKLTIKSSTHIKLEVAPTARSPSPPPTPLPEFISQFQGTVWFDKYFPNCNANTMPKPWTSQAFAVMLARVLRIAEYHEKADIAMSILAVHRDSPLSDPSPVTSVIYSLFNHSTNAPTCADPHQKAFILRALELLHALGVYDRNFFREMLVQFVDGDREIRNMVLDILHDVGLQDPHNYVTKELDSWDIWTLDEASRPKEIRRLCEDFLDKWLRSFKMHIEESIERLKLGQNIRGRATASQVLSQHKSIYKKQQVETIGENEELQTTVTFDKPPDRSMIDSATYLEALNYFCEMEMEKNLNRIRNSMAPADVKEEGPNKNTVLVLPKIAGRGVLVRLGETHTSQCRPRRETTFAADLHLPPITSRGRQPAPGEIYGFPNCINLPMKSIIMNPFGDDEAELDQQPMLLMLRTAQKYFVHNRSYVEPTEA